ncbi:MULTISPECIES: PEP/pyruvate-binding domain-containing protein [unclassified Streptomyces]|uniref:PEP/pyruvate-binding domain-containing protein n=1 Tax=unclassified Streptomyces TaxID=2593676 RepID=UPI0004C09ABC|nr:MULTISPECIES: PEP/pyruvate-binding domain-containing protein [unclassified Streptomyces]
MHSPYTLAFDSSAEAGTSRLGGKCAALIAMTRAGAPVPPGFVVTMDAFEALLDRGGLCRAVDAALAGLVADPGAVAARGAEIRCMVIDQLMPSPVASAVTAAYKEFCRAIGCPDVAVAVRSSAEGEDSPDASYAGQHDTFLWIRGADAVLDAVRRCWASLWTDRAIIYRATHGLRQRGLRMAVGVQQMVDARTSGAAVTVNPADGDPSKIVVEAIWGMGQLMVSGEVTPDAHLVDKVLLTTVRTTVSPKHQELVPAPDGHGLIRREVEERRRRVPCLAPPEVVEIARLAKTAERYYGVPQNIEWAIDRRRHASAGATAMLLQTRPEAVWSRRPRTPARVGRGAGVSSILDTLLRPGR